ncbi:hypothetical protein D9611_001723 [Ephemerocybe angulata]|uniref:Uncharacterized protein n=1 Tax=Ephemerocybe angulata TaxID=980116 RepID=A0A8H5FMG7_9AGAR|nr:hypothetical protein D9611_001723 [Tulosesus angulatus]
MPHSTSKPTVISLHIVKDAALAALSSAVQLAIDLLFLVTLTALFITLPVLFSPMSIEGSESHDHDTPIREFQPLVEEASMEWGEASAGATRQLLPESPPLVAHPSSPPAFNLLGHIREERDDVEPAGGSKGDGEEMEKDDVDYLELPRLLCISRNPREPEQLSTGLEDEGDNVRDEGRGEGALEEQGSATDGEYALGGQGSATDGQVAFEEEGWATNGEDIVRELGSSKDSEGALVEHDQNDMEQGRLTLLSWSQEKRAVCEVEDSHQDGEGSGCAPHHSNTSDSGGEACTFVVKQHGWEIEIDSLMDYELQASRSSDGKAGYELSDEVEMQ